MFVEIIDNDDDYNRTGTDLVSEACHSTFAPFLTGLCNATFHASSLPTSEKHALVSDRLKKSTLHPTDLNSYRPISQLS